jgi:hypothetical protein
MSMFSLVAQGYEWYDDEFLSPEEIAIREQEKAQLEALYEANRNKTGTNRAPVGLKKQSDINMAEQAEAKRKAQEEKEINERMIQENIRWAKDNDQWDYEKNEIIPDPYYKKPEELGGAKRREEEERKAREQVYYNEERKGMASSGPGMSEFYDKFPDQKQTSYFAPENKATGDTRSWEEIKEDFVSGVDDGPVSHNPYMGDRLKYQDKILKFMYGDAYTNREEMGGSIGYNVMDVPDYYTNQYRVPYDSPEGKDFVIDFPKDIEGAKAQADDFYIESLTRSLENATTDEEKESIQKLINNGAPTFNTREDFQSYYDLGVDVYQNKKELLDSGVAEADIPFSVNSELKDALQIQEDVMANWVYFGDGRNSWVVNDNAGLFFKDINNYEIFKEGDAYLNTGTGFTRGSLEGFLEDPDYFLGGFGENTYWIKKPEVIEQSTFSKNMSIVSDVVSILAPPAAPIIQAGKVATAGGELEDVLKAGGKAYVKGKVNDVTKEYILDTYEAIDIPVRELDLYAQSKIVDVTNDVLAGKSGTESATDAVQSIVWKNIKEEVGYTFEEFESKFDLNLPDFGLDIDLPDIDLPDLPDFDLDIDVPDFDLDIDVPDFDLDLPDIDLPDVDIPDINLPDIDLPDVDLNLPDMPDLNVDLDLPAVDLDLSGVEIPEFDFDLDLEGLDTEGLDIEMPEMPDINLPSLRLPSLNLRKQEREEKESEVEELFSSELFKHDTQVNYTQGLLAPKINLRKF